MIASFLLCLSYVRSSFDCFSNIISDQNPENLVKRTHPIFVTEQLVGLDSKLTSTLAIIECETLITLLSIDGCNLVTHTGYVVTAGRICVCTYYADVSSPWILN